MSTLATQIKEQARSLGFELVGIARADEAETFPVFQQWLNDGNAGEMRYLERHAQARAHPDSILQAVRSVVMVGMNYKPDSAPSPHGTPGGEGWGEGGTTSSVRPPHPDPLPLSTGGEGTRVLGKVARYARGPDYHEVLRAKLKELLRWIQIQEPHVHGRAVVDTAPLLERDFARRAGLGWFGKNTMLINRLIGSYFFIGALLLDIDLEPDAPFETTHCGSCTACLDACPTQAFVEPGVLDSRRCISYLTIELREPISKELRPQMGDWVFGCDVCQEVCPWNRKAPTGNAEVRAELESLDLEQLLSLSDSEFHERFRGTTLTRPKRNGLLRNAAIALGNLGDPKSLPALQKAAQDDDAVIRDAAHWAIRQIEHAALCLAEGGR